MARIKQVSRGAPIKRRRPALCQVEMEAIASLVSMAETSLWLLFLEGRSDLESVMQQG